MSKVYTLKHATPKMKYHHMLHVMAFRDDLRIKQEEFLNKKQMRNAYWAQRVKVAVNKLASIDPSGWEQWYDNEKNVPEDSTNKQISFLVEDRIHELTNNYALVATCKVHRDIFIWEDSIGSFVFSKEVGKSRIYFVDFHSKDEAIAFVDGLPDRNLGYGFVLDLIPSGMTTEN